MMRIAQKNSAQELTSLLENARLKQATQVNMEERETGGKSILEAVSRLNEIAGEVRRAAEGMTTEHKEALWQSGNLEGLTQGIVKGYMKYLSDWSG